jgi:chromosome segregation ATPase
MIDADDYLSGLDSELIMDPSISSTSSTNRGGSSSSSQPLSSSSSTISLEQLQADSAELWSAVAKLHGIQTDFAASHQAAETAAEARWLGAVRELEGMVSSVQGLSNSMQQRLGELGQAVESLSQELDELQAQVSLEDAALQSIICVMDVI